VGRDAGSSCTGEGEPLAIRRDRQILADSPLDHGSYERPRNPQLYLNREHPQVVEVLKQHGIHGGPPRLRDVLYDYIEHSVWTQLLMQTARDTSPDTGEPEYGWQEDVLDLFLDDLYPDLGSDEAAIDLPKTFEATLIFQTLSNRLSVRCIRSTTFRPTQRTSSRRRFKVTTEIHHLQSAAHPIIDNRFLAGDRVLTEDDLRPYLQPLGRSIDLSPIDERIKEIRADDDIEPQDSLIDAELAPTLHRTLDLTRYEAADAGLWHYLCIVRFPEFVHYRWDPRL